MPEVKEPIFLGIERTELRLDAKDCTALMLPIRPPCSPCVAPVAPVKPLSRLVKPPATFCTSEDKTAMLEVRLVTALSEALESELVLRLDAAYTPPPTIPDELTSP